MPSFDAPECWPTRLSLPLTPVVRRAPDLLCDHEDRSEAASPLKSDVMSALAKKGNVNLRSIHQVESDPAACLSWKLPRRDGSSGHLIAVRNAGQGQCRPDETTGKRRAGMSGRDDRRRVSPFREALNSGCLESYAQTLFSYAIWPNDRR